MHFKNSNLFKLIILILIIIKNASLPSYELSHNQRHHLIKWTRYNLAVGCLFYSNDMHELSTYSATECWTTCNLTTGCTHFTWSKLNIHQKYGACLLKTGIVGKYDATFATKNFYCGLIPSAIRALENSFVKMRLFEKPLFEGKSIELVVHECNTSITSNQTDYDRTKTIDFLKIRMLLISCKVRPSNYIRCHNLPTYWWDRASSIRIENPIHIYLTSCVYLYEEVNCNNRSIKSSEIQRKRDFNYQEAWFNKKIRSFSLC